MVSLKGQVSRNSLCVYVCVWDERQTLNFMYVWISPEVLVCLSFSTLSVLKEGKD